MVDDLYPQILKERYRLKERLGEGGMGVVYRCEDIQTGAQQAVKFLTLEQVLSKGGVQRFTHEARLLSHLTHPNIVHIYDYGVEDGLPYLIMELCLGTDGKPFTLKQLQEAFEERRLDAETLLKVMPQMLSAVSLLHEKGLIHRDLKPENFLLKIDPTGNLSLKLSDFGLVALSGDEEMQRRFELSISVSMQESVVKDRAWVGTYAFMSPEQKQGTQLEASSDVYSLGLILYRLCTGYERVNPELPSEVNPQLPAWMDTLVEKALKESPRERWMTAGKMMEFLPEAYRFDPRRPKAQPRQVRWLLPATFLLLVLMTGLFHLLSTSGSPREQMDRQAKQLSLQVSVYEEKSQVPTADTLPPHVLRLIGSAHAADLEERMRAREALRQSGRELLPILGEAIIAENEEARQQAATALGYLGVADASPLLLTALYSGPESVRRAAAESLVLLRHHAIPELTEALMSHDANARGYALYALSCIGDPAWPAWVKALGSPIDSIRDYASEMLARIGQPSIPGLIESLGTSQAAPRQLAISCLTQIGAPAAPELMLALRNEKATVRAGAVAVLGHLHWVDATLPMTVLLRDAEADVRLAAERALIEIGEPAAPALLRVFRESGRTASEHAATALAAIGKPTVANLMRALMTEPPPVREQVCNVLVRIGDPAVPQLIETLNIGDTEVRQLAARALAAMRSTLAIHSLLRLLGSEDAMVRQVAAHGLNQLQADSIPHIIELLKDESPLIHQNAQKLLGRLAANQPDQLIPALDRPDPLIRVRLAEVMVSLKAVQTFSSIIRALDDQRLIEAMLEQKDSEERVNQLIFHQLDVLTRTSDADGRARVERTIVRLGNRAIPGLVQALLTRDHQDPTDPALLLGRIGTPEVVPPLVRALRHDGNRYPRLNIAAAQGLGEARRLAAVPPLCQSQRWNNSLLRQAAVEALGKIAHSTAIPSLTRALGDESDNVRAAAAEALGMIGSAEALPALQQAAEDPDPLTRSQIANARRRIQQRSTGQ